MTDLAPTFLELAGVADPGTSYKGRAVHPITGRSLLPVLERRARAVRGPDDALVDELFGRRYVRKGRWKLTWSDVPYGNGGWSLYDIERDRGETRDLSARYPELHAHAPDEGRSPSCDDRDGTAAHVIKGGSYLCAPNFCARYRATARHAHDPTLPTAHIGFRTVKAEAGAGPR